MRIHIKNVNINVGQQRSSMPMITGLLASIAKAAEAKINTPSVMASSNKAIPAIGEKWGGLDAIYAGVARGENGEPDSRLILWDAKPEKDMKYKDAHNWAVSVHPATNSHIATRFESALLYANLKDQFETDNWYWTSTPHSSVSVYDQLFRYGSQGDSGIHDERRVRAVSRLPL